jgi:hypothetical protein
MANIERRKFIIKHGMIGCGVPVWLLAPLLRHALYDWTITAGDYMIGFPVFVICLGYLSGAVQWSVMQGSKK